MTTVLERREEAEMAGGAGSELAEVLARFDERFDLAEARNAERFERIDERFDRADERLARAEEKTDERFARLEEKIDERFVQVDERFAGVDERFKAGDEKNAIRHEEVVRRLNYLDGQLERTNDRVDFMARAMVAGNLSLIGVLIAGLVTIVAVVLGQG